MACGYALVGETERSLDCLERASMHGMAIADWAENDSDLHSLHGSPRFRALIDRLRTREEEAPPATVDAAGDAASHPASNS